MSISTKKGDYNMKIKMSKKTGISVLVALVAAVFLAVSIVPSAISAPPDDGSRGPWGSGKFKQRHHRANLGIWRSQQAVEQLGLTEEQVQQLRDADFTSREKRLTLKTELDQLRLQMDKAFSQEPSNKKSVLQLAEKAAELQGELFVQKTEDRLNLETILNADQIQKLEANSSYQRRGGIGSGRRSYGRHHWGGGYGGYDGYGDRDCPRLR